MQRSAESILLCSYASAFCFLAATLNRSAHPRPTVNRRRSALHVAAHETGDTRMRPRNSSCVGECNECASHSPLNPSHESNQNRPSLPEYPLSATTSLSPRHIAALSISPPMRLRNYTRLSKKSPLQNSPLTGQIPRWGEPHCMTRHHTPAHQLEIPRALQNFSIQRISRAFTPPDVPVNRVTMAWMQCLLTHAPLARRKAAATSSFPLSSEAEEGPLKMP
nr:hypothetical protein CFP56_36159 [Quercus suber]